ncbi:protein kinase domain-containing protein [Actinacidiphila yeochonensis]|uniref:protein kinase domain-containing protein n=1 Tax=Actinacidiphila yeochonensis TaxID=89050 RepID=UPI0007C875B3|nr:protein kinase [Actinacidiphila yeochonensis]
MADPNETSAPTGPVGTPAPFGVGSMVGDGRYRLTGRLGRGGMAEVFAAEDVRLGRSVAVKLLRSDLAEDAVAKARFAREAQSVAGLNHHAVVAVYDSGEDQTASGPVPYMVMELVEGRTIKELLTGATPPPADQALLIVSGVLEALAYSHQHGIVHRDIKPANVIITTTGAVKVMDFGIARALHGASTTMTQTGMVMGTPQYLSPEQALGKTVDHRSDLYATGCLLYELLTLRPPFVGESPLSVVYQHVQDEPVPPSRMSDRVPPELDGLVLRSLAKQPDDRFQNAEEMGGVVGYAHQALTQRGGWTGGMWNTGAVTAVTPTAPTRPVQSAGYGSNTGYGSGGGYGTGYGGDGTTGTAPVPLAAGSGTGGETGYGYGGAQSSGGGGGGGRWLRPLLFVAAAVVAIALGVYFATQGGGGGATPASSTTAPSVTQGPDQQPSDQPTDQPPDTGQFSAPPTYDQSDAPTTAPSETASTTPSSTETTTMAPRPTHTTPTVAPTTPTQKAPPTTSAPDPSGGDSAGQGGTGGSSGGSDTAGAGDSGTSAPGGGN